jgi:hypothetical protein
VPGARSRVAGRAGAAGEGAELGTTTGAEQGRRQGPHRGARAGEEGRGGRERGRGEWGSPRGSKFGDNCHQIIGHNGEEREVGEWELCSRKIE